jgi:uncharacterized membrane protein
LAPVVSPAPQAQTRIQLGGIKRNLVGLACYAGMLIGFLGLAVPVVFLVIEPYKKMQFVRFHAFQSLLVNGTIVVIGFFVGLSERGSGFSGRPMSTLIFIITILLSVFLMAKAYLDEMFKLPAVGDVALKLSEGQSTS